MIETFDEADDMCPNCVTPWKCNGPHLSEQTVTARRLARPAPPSEGLDELRALSEAATPGPWANNPCKGTDGGDDCWQETPHQDIYAVGRAKDGGGLGVADISGNRPEAIADAAFIVAAVNYVRAALTPADQSDARTQHLVNAVRDIWSSHIADGHDCATCRAWATYSDDGNPESVTPADSSAE